MLCVINNFYFSSIYQSCVKLMGILTSYGPRPFVEKIFLGRIILYFCQKSFGCIGVYVFLNSSVAVFLCPIHLLTYLILMQILHSIIYFSCIVIFFLIRKYKPSNFVLFQDYFGYSGSLLIPYEFHSFF